MTTNNVVTMAPSPIVGKLVKVAGAYGRVLACDLLPPASGRGWSFVLLAARERSQASDGELMNLAIGEELCKVVDEPAPSVAPPFVAGTSALTPGGQSLTGEDLARMTPTERRAAIGDVVNGVRPQPGAYAAAAELFAWGASPTCVLDETGLYRFPRVIAAIESVGLKLNTADGVHVATAVEWAIGRLTAELGGETAVQNASAKLVDPTVDLRMRCVDIANEQFGPFEVMTAEDSLTAIEQGIFKLRQLVTHPPAARDLAIKVGRQAKHIASLEQKRKEIANDCTTYQQIAESAGIRERNALAQITAKDLALAELSRRAAAAETARDEATSELAALKLRGRECVTGCGEAAVGNGDTCDRDECLAEVNAKTRELVRLRECAEAADRTMGEQAAEIQQLNQRCYDLARQITAVTAVPTILPELLENSVERPGGRLCWECADGSFVPVGDDGRASLALLAWGRRLVAERNQARANALALQKRIDDFTRPVAVPREYTPNAAICTAVPGCIRHNGHSGLHEIDVTRWPTVTTDPMREGAPSSSSNGSLAERVGLPKPQKGG